MHSQSQSHGRRWSVASCSRWCLWAAVGTCLNWQKTCPQSGGKELRLPCQSQTGRQMRCQKRGCSLRRQVPCQGDRQKPCQNRSQLQPSGFLMKTLQTEKLRSGKGCYLLLEVGTPSRP